MVNADEAVVDVADDGDVGPERNKRGRRNERRGLPKSGSRLCNITTTAAATTAGAPPETRPVISKPSERIGTLAPAAPFGWREVVVLSVVTDRVEELMEAIHEGPCFAFVCRVLGFQAFVSMDCFCLNLRFKA